MAGKAALAVAISAPAIVWALPYTVNTGASNVVLVHGAYVDGAFTWQ